MPTPPEQTPTPDLRAAADLAARRLARRTGTFTGPKVASGAGWAMVAGGLACFIGAMVPSPAQGAFVERLPDCFALFTAGVGILGAARSGPADQRKSP